MTFTKRKLRPTPSDYRAEVLGTLINHLKEQGLMTEDEATFEINGLDRNLNEKKVENAIVWIMSEYVTPLLINPEQASAIVNMMNTYDLENPPEGE
jgi:hypothetical protein